MKKCYIALISAACGSLGTALLELKQIMRVKKLNDETEATVEKSKKQLCELIRLQNEAKEAIAQAEEKTKAAENAKETYEMLSNCIIEGTRMGELLWNSNIDIQVEMQDSES